MKIDLHSHSTYSDGTLDPNELVEKAAECGVTHLGLCDHDSTGGLQEAREKAEPLNLTIIPSVEINSRETSALHILGYFVDENDEQLQKRLSHHRDIRIKRTQLILERLQKMGIKISFSDFSRKNAAAIGRPHIADKLKEKGLVFSRQEAFNKFLSQGRPAYVFYEGPTPQDAIEIILGSKGIPVVAHPGFSVTEEAISNLARLGLQGIEVYYPTHSAEQIKNFVQIAERYNLITTGGSDYHGPGSGHENLGEVSVPENTLDRILERKHKLFG